MSTSGQRIRSRPVWKALAVALVAFGAEAQAWKDVTGYVDNKLPQLVPESRILLDEASPTPSERAGVIHFRYRSIGNSLFEPNRSTTLEYAVAVNCTTLSIQNLKIQGVNPGYNTDVEISEPMRRKYAADPFSPLGRAAMQACEVALPGSLERFRSVPSAEECLQPRSPYEFALCKADGIRLAIGVVRERTRAVTVACGEQPVYGQALDQALTRALGCIAQAQCIRRAVGPLALAIDPDVARLEDEGVLSSSDCESARKLRREMDEARQKEQASQDLRSAEDALSSCAEKALRRLDDGASAVEVVAKAAVSSCKVELGKLAEVALRSEPAADKIKIRSRIEEGLVGAMLEGRTKKRRR